MWLLEYVDVAFGVTLAESCGFREKRLQRFYDGNRNGLCEMVNANMPTAMFVDKGKGRRKGDSSDLIDDGVDTTEYMIKRELRNIGFSDCDADVKREIKELIEKLQKELDELKDYKACKNEIEAGYRNVVAKLKKAELELEDKYRNMNLHKLLRECCITGWEVSYRVERGEKCDKCDAGGYRTFTSPQGRTYREECNCHKGTTVYFPDEAKLVQIYASRNGYPAQFFYGKANDSYDKWTRCALVADGNFKPEDIDRFHTVFANKEDCEKYCEWLNNKEKNNE